MRGQLLQDWVTIRSGTNVNAITQGADAWVDLGDAEDLVIFLDVREVSGSPKITFQTSPTKQDASFVAMMPAATLATGVTLVRVFANMAAVPAARYVRWYLSSTISTDVTFRVWLATYAWLKVAG